MNTKGQGTIEYLVIIAIVVVIALVVVGLLLQIMGNFGGTGEQAAKISWASAEPWAITDWVASGSTLTLVLKNQTADTLQFNSFSITGTDGNTTAMQNVGPGQERTIAITGISCTSGSKYAFPKTDISIDFNKGTLANMRQNGVADITGTCN